jgi:hypothetical protein
MADATTHLTANGIVSNTDAGIAQLTATEASNSA